MSTYSIRRHYMMYDVLFHKNGIKCTCICMVIMFVCVEVLWPSQPNGVMSSAVSLPNHTFTGQT